MSNPPSSPVKTMIWLFSAAALVIPLLHLLRFQEVISESNFRSLVMIFTLVFLIFYFTVFFYWIKKYYKTPISFSIQGNKRRINTFIENFREEAPKEAVLNYFTGISFFTLGSLLLNGSYTFPILFPDEKIVTDEGMLVAAIFCFLLGLFAIVTGKWKESNSYFRLLKRYKTLFALLNVVVAILFALAISQQLSNFIKDLIGLQIK